MRIIDDEQRQVLLRRTAGGPIYHLFRDPDEVLVAVKGGSKIYELDQNGDKEIACWLGRYTLHCIPAPPSRYGDVTDTWQEAAKHRQHTLSDEEQHRLTNELQKFDTWYKAQAEKLESNYSVGRAAWLARAEQR